MTKMLCLLLNVSYGGTLMRNINLFVEDVAHEDFLIALIQRLARFCGHLAPEAVVTTLWLIWKYSQFLTTILTLTDFPGS